MRTRCLLSMVLFAAACSASPTPAAEVTAARPAPAATPDVIEESWFRGDGAPFEREASIEIGGDTPGTLVYRFGPISDSGVELERRAGETVLWRVHVAPLGIAHSKYHYDVTVRVEGDRIVVDSIGARRIAEVRDLATGKQVSREITDVR